MKELLAAAQAMGEEIVQWRRTIHQYAEVGIHLPKTADFVMQKLTEMGYQPEMICDSGIVAVVEGAHPGKTILVRADMDALPMQEINDLPFKSTNGCGHTCGHDTHTAMLLGAARLLMQNRDKLYGRVKLMFQPGEEGYGGALLMLKSGVLENPKVDACIGMHSSAATALPTGCIGFCPGPAMASADMFYIHVNGRGCHGSRPEEGIDPINILTHIHLALQAINSRECNQQEKMVLTVGHITSGDAPNIIPQTGYMSGTIRTFNNDVRKFVKKRLEEIVKGIAATFNGEVKVEWNEVASPTINDPAMTEQVMGYVTELLGGDRVMQVPPVMGSEDFAEVMLEVPGVYMRCGMGSVAEGYTYGGHNPYVQFNEEALPTGAAVYAYTAMRWLEDQAK